MQVKSNRARADQSKRARAGEAVGLRPRPSVADIERRRDLAISRASFCSALAALTAAAYAIMFWGSL